MHAEGWFALGHAQLRSNDYVGASHAATRAVQLDPENPEGWNNLAALLLHQDKHQAAFWALQVGSPGEGGREGPDGVECYVYIHRKKKLSSFSFVFFFLMIGSFYLFIYFSYRRVSSGSGIVGRRGRITPGPPSRARTGSGLSTP